MSDYDPTDLDAVEARKEEAKAISDQDLRNEVEDLRWLMRNKRGRRVVWRFLSNAGVYRLSYQVGDAFATAFAEGQRNGGLRLLSLIQAWSPVEYGLMVQERNDV